MALVAAGGILVHPQHFTPLQYVSATYGLTIDAAGEKVAHLFQVPKTGNIDRVGFYVKAVTAAQTLKAGLYTVDSSGAPTTNAYGGMVAGTQAAPSQETFYEVILGTAAAATAGDYVALVVEFNADVGNLSIGYFYAGITYQPSGFPRTVHYTSSWASSNNRIPNMLIRYDDATYGNIPNVFPMSAAMGADIFASGSRGIRFNLPYKTRVIGGTFFGQIGSDVTLSLLDAAFSSTLATITVDKDYGEASNLAWHHVLFPTPVECEANTNYFLAVTSSGASVETVYIPHAAAHKGAMPGGTCFAYHAGGTVTTTKHTVMSLLIDQIDYTATSSSTSSSPAPYPFSWR